MSDEKLDNYLTATCPNWFAVDADQYEAVLALLDSDIPMEQRTVEYLTAVVPGLPLTHEELERIVGQWEEGDDGDE